MTGFGLAVAKTLLFHIACFRNDERYFAVKGRLMRTAARHGLYEQRYLEILPSFVASGSTVVDAGANFGAYTHALARLAGTTGRVIAFEPLPPVADCLMRSCARLRHVTVIREALSDRTDDRLELLVPYIGWKVPEPALARPGDPRAAGDLWRSFRVSARRLDDHADLVDGVRFIKADLEGHEMDFLTGAQATILRSRPIIQIESAGIARRRDDAGAWLRATDYVLFTFRHGRFRRAGAEDTLSLNVYLVPSEAASELPSIFEPIT